MWPSKTLFHHKVCELSPDVVHHSGHVYPLSRLRSELSRGTALLWQPGESSSFISALQKAWETRLSRSVVRGYFLEHWSFDALARQAISIYNDVVRHRNLSQT